MYTIVRILEYIFQFYKKLALYVQSLFFDLLNETNAKKKNLFSPNDPKKYQYRFLPILSIATGVPDTYTMKELDPKALKICSFPSTIQGFLMGGPPNLPLCTTLHRKCALFSCVFLKFLQVVPPNLPYCNFRSRA